MLPLRTRPVSGTMRALQTPLHHTARGFRTGLEEPLAEIGEAWSLSERQPRPGEATPPDLLEAFEHLFDAMAQTEAIREGSGSDGVQPASCEAISELGEYALELFDQVSSWARHLELPGVFQTLQTFTIALACWIAEHGGQLVTLDPIVDAIAQSANSTQDPAELLALYQAMSTVIGATSTAISQDLDKGNPGRPWRLLHLNRAIVATRTHQPDVMEAAFSELVDRLPEDAPPFFTQGMEQMDLLNYPPHVREIMDRYYRKWSVKHSLH